MANITTQNLNQRFGAWLKREIEKAGYNQSEVAHHIGITPVQMSRIITGVSGTRIETVEAICKFIGLDKFQAYAMLELTPSPPTSATGEDDVILLFHLRKGETVPVQITDAEILAATRKALRDKLSS